MNKLLTRANLAFLHDIVMAALSFLAALYLRLGDQIWSYAPEVIWQDGLIFVVVTAIVLRASGVYRGIWRYASLNDLMAIGRGVTLSILIFVPILFLLNRGQDFPRSVVVINWFVLIIMLGASRFLYRAYKDRRLDLKLALTDMRRVPVLLIGAGDTAELFIRDLGRDPEASYRIVGILDDKGARVGRDIHGIKVLGTADELEPALARLAAQGEAPERIVIANRAMDGQRIRAILDVAERRNIPLSRLPSLTDFRPGGEEKPEIRPVAIQDLLGRPQAVLHREDMRALIEGKRVLVTGAGGTIGGELVRQIGGFNPAALHMLDHGEYLLYAIDLEIGERLPGLPRHKILADVRDANRVREVFQQIDPQIVFHAAALKHVPIVEENPSEGVLTNVIGTRNVADAAFDHGVEVMVMISTDKAVNPVNVMGASKRLAEAYCQALDRENSPTRFVTVRFGNVLGSTGSVVPLFERQLHAGGPLTVTHPEVKRYFMTVREAVELVLEASTLRYRENINSGKLFVLDMGEPVLIADLARQMIRLAGLREGSDIRIEYVGLRPGEKLSEELFHSDESLMPTPHGAIRLAAPRAGELAQLRAGIARLEEMALAWDDAACRATLAELVPEYGASAQEREQSLASGQGG
ncbi:MAG: nucleoside-diphosphate sugar epimerase/dehydratase [Alphaproteobacteria bacterium]